MMIARATAAVVLLSLAAAAEPPSGRWDALLKSGDLEIPVRILFRGDAGKLEAAFSNGPVRVAVAGEGSLAGGVLKIAFPEIGARLEAKYDGESLTGTYVTPSATYRIMASKYCACAYEGEAGPDIASSWAVPELNWRVQLRREGDDTIALIDEKEKTRGPFAGRFDGASFVLHHFDGRRVATLELTPTKDGALDVVFRESGERDRKARAMR